MKREEEDWSKKPWLSRDQRGAFGGIENEGEVGGVRNEWESQNGARFFLISELRNFGPHHGFVFFYFSPWNNDLENLRIIYI